jgi:hypothetical protein
MVHRPNSSALLEAVGSRLENDQEPARAQRHELCCYGHRHPERRAVSGTARPATWDIPRCPFCRRGPPPLAGGRCVPRRDAGVSAPVSRGQTRPHTCPRVGNRPRGGDRPHAGADPAGVTPPVTRARNTPAGPTRGRPGGPGRGADVPTSGAPSGDTHGRGSGHLSGSAAVPGAFTEEIAAAHYGTIPASHHHDIRSGPAPRYGVRARQPGRTSQGAVSRRGNRPSRRCGSHGAGARCPDATTATTCPAWRPVSARSLLLPNESSSVTTT